MTAKAKDAALPGGLSNAEARRRLAEFGPNATPDPAVNSFRLLLGKFIAPVPCLLEAAIVLQLLLHEYVEAAVITGLLVFNALLGFMQEARAQSTIAALKSRLALRASVQRDGAWTTISATELVIGDLVKLSLGGVVAADMRLVAGSVLLDQSMITGESLPVEAGPGFGAFAGALVRRGEALAEVVATGARTKLGRAVELVRTARVAGAQERAIFRVVRNLAVLNGCVVLGMIAYAQMIAMPLAELLPLVLVAILATVPVALPATFTLATALGAQALAKQGVLPTRLSAIDEAASMDVLCSDKTGTLTRNRLEVTAVRTFSGADEVRVLELAALASSEGGQDPVDQAVRLAARSALPGQLKLIDFVPFDPATKIAEARVEDGTGVPQRVVKGAFSTVARLCVPSPGAAETATELELQGYRVLGVAFGTSSLRLVGILALSDPPRPDALPAIAELRRLGLKVVMVTGDAPATAGVIARAVGVGDAVYPPGAIQDAMNVDAYDVFAGLLPEDKFRLVQALQREGHTVGMCGDGANDAPALRQAQVGIAVSTATDVAKSAAGVVLTEPGLGGIVASVREGRITFQRILTYTLRSIAHKVRQVLLLAIGLLMTDHAILTPMLMVLLMIVGDFLAMSATTDNVAPSLRPNSWRIGNLTVAGAVIGLFDLAFCGGVLALGRYWLDLSVGELQTLSMVTLVLSGQAVFYVVRERRRLWSSWPSRIVVLSSIVDLLIVPPLAVFGILMTPLSPWLILGLLAAVAIHALALDFVKTAIFRRLRMT